MNGDTAKFNMYKGTITGNYTGDKGVGGGAIYAELGATVTMYGGTIENNRAPGKTCGGIYLSGATFEMTGGTIQNNTGGNAPHGVNLKSGNGGSITINGSTITTGGYDTIIFNNDGSVSKN